MVTSTGVVELHRNKGSAPFAEEDEEVFYFINLD